jgi:uncharacterized RDD family membrane protein YckC
MTPQTQTRPAFCSECGQPTRPDELARFGDRLVCPNCKNAYAQKLREGVAPAGFVQYGGFWLRFVAVLIDGTITGIAIGILQAMLFAVTGLSMTQIAQRPNPGRPEDIFAALAPVFGIIGLSALIGMALSCAYEAFFLVKFGATPGKMALGLKVVRPDGSGITAGRAIGRYFGKVLSGIILYIGYIMAGFDAQKRALHDMICDTRVIKTR